MIFDKDYYDETYPGGLHNHVYDELARQLVKKYGPVSFLDVGCGCGYLVKKLGEKDCKAWGLENSEYALENSCIPDYIVQGSATNMPFKDKEFDVVFSQGLFEYLTDDEIDKVWLECQRVGKKQYHVIDPYDGSTQAEKFVTKQSLDWWKGRLKTEQNCIIT